MEYKGLNTENGAQFLAWESDSQYVLKFDGVTFRLILKLFQIDPLMKSTVSFFLLISSLFFACKNPQLNEDPVDPDAIYFDYKITAEEGNDNLTVMLQFRDGEEGDAVSIPGPGSVLLDGELLEEDSTKMTGVFYEIHKPIAGFAGKHSIVFTNADKKQYKEEFEFKPMNLLKPIPDSLRRNDLILELDGIDEKELLTILLTDTSSYHDGINKTDSVVNGRLVITRADLDNLSNGPVQLEIIREIERPVHARTKEGGRLLIRYSLRREFFLQN